MPNRHAWMHTLVARGSVFPRIYKRLAFFGLSSIALTYAARAGWFAPLPLALHAIIGSAIGLHIAFRTNTGYERFWEARTAWGAIINRTRNIARQVHVLLTGDERRLVIRLAIVFVHASKRHFWRESFVPEAEALLGPAVAARVHGAPGPPQRALLELGRALLAARRRGDLDAIDQHRIERDVTALIDQFGICERIRATPLPNAYVIQLRGPLALFLATLPLSLAPEVGWYAPLLALFLGYLFLGMEQIGTELEDPFEKSVNDVDMAGISEKVENDLLALCEDETPGSPTGPVPARKPLDGQPNPPAGAAW